MPTFAVRRTFPAPAADAWGLLTDWPAHGRWVPFTTVTVTTDTGGAGTRFVGRTGVGPVGFDDPMEVLRWEPPSGDRPGTCTVRKLGRVVLGWAQVTVRPLGPARCEVTWAEDVEIAPTRWTWWASPVVTLAGRVAFAALLWQAARESRRA